MFLSLVFLFNPYSNKVFDTFLAKNTDSRPREVSRGSIESDLRLTIGKS